ncbi:hypothetical protein B9C88_22315 [Brevibacillus laterosporus]|nr:hypothetical protein [Brevibacillus laterosporus]PCN42178.1 hypothetical protein B9C88_22315 [Brevibacillus laterosporus]
MRYRYDENSQLTHLIYPDGKVGRLIKTVRPNGTIEQRSYDIAGQMVRL